MREIKFRSKRTDNNEWVYGFYRGWRDLNDNPYSQIQTSTDEHGNFTTFYVVPELVGQCTGLKDKNGVEIYEDDIVKSVALSNDHNQRGAVTISPVKIWCGNACLTITYIPIYPFCVNHTLEVIGNIHDNPELLD